ncbi:MAG: methylenetetrahydrofolate reductase [Pseudomonadota bacterium]
MNSDINTSDIESTVQAFMRDFTLETTPGQAAKLESYQGILREGTTVAVTFLPGSDYRDTVKTAARLRAEGFEPAPHFAARSIASRDEFNDFVARCAGEAGVNHVVALAGGVDNPVGPYDSSMAILETGIFDKHGIAKVGVAGHPEGSPDISDALLTEALQWKNALSERTDAELYIATQFVFEAEPVIAWDKAIQAEGNRLPIHIGVPGLATIKTLLAHAKACGVGPSMRFLTRQAMNVAKLMTVSAPDKLVTALAQYQATDPDCGISHVHMYPLGSFKKTADWSYAVADGAIRMNAKRDGFEVDLPSA